MKPYTRPKRRPYPSVTRALHQTERALRVPVCPGCRHPVRSHAVEGGHRVCTRGYGRVACRDCAHTQVSLVGVGGLVAQDFMTGLERAVRRFSIPGPFGLSQSPDQDGSVP